MTMNHAFQLKEQSETIAAAATPISNSGIGIIRVSGTDAISVVDRIYCNAHFKQTLKDYPTHTIHYGYIFKEDNVNHILDEVMVSVMKAPNSYTREDTVEINCHGGVVVMNEILHLLTENGARIAQPGEFTKRAFLNGRIDLTKAEAVMDVIGAKNRYALESSVKQLKGSVYRIIQALREKIIYEIAFIESALDDPEHISLDGYPEKLTQIMTELSEKCKRLLNTAQNGRILKEGIRTVIVGKPNAGKSSLLNTLSGAEKAIVTDIAGTTRDALEENIYLDGINLNLIDTAGIRHTEDAVEKIGVERARNYVKEADLILYVCDTSVPFDENDREIWKLLSGKKVIVLFNKSDLPSVVTPELLYENMKQEEPDLFSEMTVDQLNPIIVSAYRQTGLEELRETIHKMFLSGKIEQNEEVFLTNLRHVEAIKDTMQSFEKVKESLAMDLPEDFYSIDLMAAYASLGSIIGEEVSDDLVNEIFSKFCMGK